MCLDLSSKSEIDPRVDELSSLHYEGEHRNWFLEETREKRTGRLVKEWTQISQTVDWFTITGRGNYERCE